VSDIALSSKSKFPLKRTRIKICGLKTSADVAAAVSAGADAVGFVFYEKSVRAVTVEQAVGLVRLLPPFVTPVALFVNPLEALTRAVGAALPSAVFQFHGDESAQACEILSAGRPFIKAARMTYELDLLNFAQRFSSAQALLLDAAVDGYGGGGKVFDWSLVPPNVPIPVVLSGGLTPANVIDGVRLLRPWAVDVSSGVESVKGVKDGALIHAFCCAVHEADARCADEAI
jgi:phosphoribosylanthranilate isomerase